MEGVLKDLIKKRSIIKGRLTKFKDYVNTLKQVGSTKITAVQIKDLSMRVDKFQELLTEFSALQTEIELLSANIDEQITERDALETQFFSLLSVSQDLIENCSSNKILQENESVVGSCSHSPFNSIKLPTINLAKFDGNYLKWLEFRDTFDSLINDNESIPLINKFHYLRSSLEGGAAVVIRSIEFTANNYKNAWQLLCDRYNNKNILINNHLKSLMSVEPMTKESFKALRFMIDHISKNLRSLQALGLPTDQWDILLIFIMSAKLDSITSRKWEEYKNNLKELPTLDDFYSFLRNRADILETTHYNRSEKHEQRPHFNNRTVRSFVTSSEESTKRYQLCVVCNQPHLVYECPKFKEMDIDDRAREVSKFKLCSICLRSGHNTYQCRLKGSCRVCKGKHNTLLHRQPATALLLEQVAPSASTAPGPVALSAVTMTHTLLCTARVQLVNEENNCTVMARALLDTGSQSSFLSEHICNKLGLRKDCNKRLSVCGLNNIKCDISGSCDVKIKSCLSPFSAQVSCLLVPTITGTLPGFEINTQQLNIPDNIELADPNFFQPSSIDILLGSDIFWSIIETNQIKLGSNMPTLQESKLGWLIAGPIGIHTQPKKKVYCNFSLVDLDRTIKKFWQVEELPSDEKTLSLEEQFCESNFVETTTRLEDGRFCVKMPLKEPETVLGDSFYLAKKRFANLENKLNKDPQLKESYSAFINEYENLGHLSEVERPESGNYLPHHSVTRHKSETTKLRVVFHASAKTSSGKSLNDILAVGPVIQSDLMSILLRFRGHRFVLLGDIEKMYRQIALHPSQRHLQLILWKDYSPIDNEDQASSQIKTLQLNTVTYGTASAPFISTRCILQLANECSDDTIATVIKNDFYIDDLNTGAETESELQYIYKNVNNVLRAACLPLRKIRTNCSQAFTNEETITDIVDLTKESSVLGLSYCPKNDMIQFSANIEPASQHTKRSVISTTCKIFDPLGLISAVVITAKIFLQKLWVEKLTWDEPIPKRILGVWLCFINNLHLISKIKITRNVMCDAPILKDLHCFVDASQAAYGACVYIRSVNESNEVTVRLLCAKARVCPLGCTTIPRKELLGALLGARLCAKVIKSFRFEIANKTIWTDSTVVLGWLKTDVKNLKPFVCNRVNEINELTVGFQLRHVPTSMNPADLASRGVDPQNIASSSLWWEGPAFLKKGEDGWPQGSCAPEELPELKVLAPSFTGLVNATESFIDFSRYSNLTRLIRIFAFVLRFVNNCKKEKQKLSGPLNLTELNDSHTILMKCCQLESFSTEIKDLEKGKRVNIKSKLLNLTPFIDADGIVRVGGRLNNSSYNFEKAHQIILDSKQKLCKLIMIHEHMRLFHAGPQLTLASVRDRYWPIGGRHLARNIVKQCVTCIRLRATTVQPIMGHLPEARTAAGFAFNSVGVDFAGPFLIASRKGRGSSTTKCYLCLFVCLSTKAVHLELVSDLSTQAFILCLRRFLARRGYPYEIYCDNGRNFVGANNELGRALRSSRRSVFEYSTGEGIKFVFSPAYSPHFGGIFEAGIKSAKHHLKRVAGNAALTFEELATLFTQIEAILNSRPLSPLSSDCTDPSPLTPGHFLIGRPLKSIPTVPIKATRPNRYELIEKIRQHFWERWSREYIAELQQRTKWRTPQKDLACGDLVILKEDNLAPLQWRLGRVCRLYPGNDGVTRVVDITTVKGVIRRAVNKLCLLPVSDDKGREEADSQ
jgi:hypothetical protein